MTATERAIWCAAFGSAMIEYSNATAKSRADNAVEVFRSLSDRANYEPPGVTYRESVES